SFGQGRDAAAGFWENYAAAAANLIEVRKQGDYDAAMSTGQDIETAIRKLSREELSAFRTRFVEFDAAAWDRQFEEDVYAGRLETVEEGALQDFHEGRCHDMQDIEPASHPEDLTS